MRRVSGRRHGGVREGGGDTRFHRQAREGDISRGNEGSWCWFKAQVEERERTCTHQMLMDTF